jgi:hypothetical protein
LGARRSDWGLGVEWLLREASVFGRNGKPSVVGWVPPCFALARRAMRPSPHGPSSSWR